MTDYILHEKNMFSVQKFSQKKYINLNNIKLIHALNGLL